MVNRQKAANVKTDAAAEFSGRVRALQIIRQYRKKQTNLIGTYFWKGFIQPQLTIVCR